jgi:hypothetical protein
MNFLYNDLKATLAKKYSNKLDRKIIDELLTFEQGILTDRFPNKRLSIRKTHFTGVKQLGISSGQIVFKKDFAKGTNLISCR